MKEIHYIQQPTEYLCGQACVAMIANVSVDDVIRVMNNDQATGKTDIERALDHYGIRQAKTIPAFHPKFALFKHGGRK